MSSLHCADVTSPILDSFANELARSCHLNDGGIKGSVSALPGVMYTQVEPPACV